MKTLIIDVSNLLFRVAAVQRYSPIGRDASPKDLIGLCLHSSLFSINKWYQKFNPDFVIFAFEGKNNWRKEFTAKNNTRLQYKANRVVDPTMQHFFELIRMLQEIVTVHTSVCCLCVETMEADDVIAAYCQLYSSPNDEIFIVSSDKDFVQLLGLPNVKLVSPDDGKLRNQPGDKDYEKDIDYWIFRKCIRGDMGDHVPSAYPRVRETVIRKAYNNTYELINFMNQQWNDINQTTHTVKTLYEENRILLDLSQQPLHHRRRLEESVHAQVKNFGSYSYFHFLRFLTKHELNSVAEKIKNFNDIFMNNQRYIKRLTLQSTVDQPVDILPMPSNPQLLAF